MTTMVVPTTSFRAGHVTFFISPVVSRKNSRVASHHCFGFAMTPFSFLSSAIWNTLLLSTGSPQLAEGFFLPCELRTDSLRACEVWQAKRDSNPQPAVLE